ncbi:sensor histidine kinase [Nocardia caishijiensis]|uniref:histidine kinase n=1 Tax=Nocardia caishijiensis TaxID=184756 RepID=A0ABQ6YGM6_9NOCA|nr:histidine kinase [Nocardia caishijiensis]KAF0844937.1 signal transduction histidine kinase [Nocardia caishijiensis]
MRRFSLWLRGRPIVADSLLAAMLLFFDVLGVGEARNKAVYLVLSVLLPMPVILRRLYPRATAAALLVLSLLCTLISYLLNERTAPHVALIGLGVMLYTLVAYVGRRDGLIYVGFLAIDLGLSVLLVQEPKGGDLILVGAIYALCWTLAEFNGARHAYDAEVAARLAVADYDKERRAHEAVAAERTRIARELHDVVAHAVSVIIVQADGAKYALRTDPAAAERALATIAGTGRDALRELRRTVTLLRTEHAPELLPQHGSAGIAHLAQMMREAGLAVDLELTGELDDITPEVSLGVHRIVQESLTNTLRHAGASPKAVVRVQRGTEEVLVEITDSGGVPVQESAIHGGGMGLVGMRERVAVLGGTLHAGRLSDGRWEVSARLPLRAETD